MEFTLLQALQPFRQPSGRAAARSHGQGGGRLSGSFICPVPQPGSRHHLLPQQVPSRASHHLWADSAATLPFKFDRAAVHQKRLPVSFRHLENGSSEASFEERPPRPPEPAGEPSEQPSAQRWRAGRASSCSNVPPPEFRVPLVTAGTVLLPLFR